MHCDEIEYARWAVISRVGATLILLFLFCGTVTWIFSQERPQQSFSAFTDSRTGEELEAEEPGAGSPEASGSTITPKSPEVEKTYTIAGPEEAQLQSLTE